MIMEGKRNTRLSPKGKVGLFFEIQFFFTFALPVTDRKVPKVEDKKEKGTADKNNLNRLGIGHPTDDEQQRAYQHGHAGLFGLPFFGPASDTTDAGRKEGIVMKSGGQEKEVKNDRQQAENGSHFVLRYGWPLKCGEQETEKNTMICQIGHPPPLVKKWIVFS